jgi:hypothetical protein
MRLQNEAYAHLEDRLTFPLTNSQLVQIFFAAMKAFSAILSGILLTFGGVTIAQPSTIDGLEEAARSAQSGDPAAIRTLTDIVVSQLPLTFHATLKMNYRLFQAELQYRQQARTGVRIDQLVLALNQLADNLKLPRYVQTNANQVRTYGMMAARVYPLFFSPAAGRNQTADFSLSPSAAMFLLVQLFHMKMIEPSYQTDPDTWARDVQARMKEAASRPPSRSAVFTVAKRSTKEEALARRYEAFAREVASNSGRTVRPVQAMLKTLEL